MIQTTNLQFAYQGAQWALDGLNIQIPRGGIWGLLGKNGVGKTTLLQLLAGILPPHTPNSVQVNGHAPFGRSVEFLEGVFLLPEEFALPRTTILELVRCYGGFYPNFSHAQLLEILAEFEVDSNQVLHRMSLGQRKKAYIAFALATNTDLLLLDEPTNGLDIPSKMIFRQLMARYADQNRTIIISSHQVRDLEEILDGVLMLDNHKVLLCATIQAISGGLHFGILDDAESAKTAIFSQPSLYGTIGIRAKQQGDVESKIDLELLFNAVSAHPTAIQQIIDNQ